MIEGLADGRIGFYAKVHHAAVDGQAGVAMGRSMFDLTAEPRPVKPPRKSRSQDATSSASPSCSAPRCRTRSSRCVETASCCRRSRAPPGAPRRRRSRRGGAKTPMRGAQGRGAARASSSRRRRRSTPRSPTSARSPRVSLPLRRGQADRQVVRRVDQRHRAVAVQHRAAQLPEGRQRAARRTRWSPACRSRCARKATPA